MTYYLRARYYSPGTGRFLTEDTYRGYQSDPLSLSLYNYCASNPIRYIDASGNSFKDTLYGMVEVLDDSITDGFVKWSIHILTGYSPSYIYESEYDYYLGRVIGGALSVAVGVGTSAAGIAKIVASIAVGGGITVGSGGILVAGGVSISVVGVVAGAAEVTIGGVIVASATTNFSSDFSKFQNIRLTTKQATEAAENLGYKKINQYSHGQPVYERVNGNGPKYITPDVDGHNGGVWKGADSVKNLGSKTTRAGTYNSVLQRIGD